MIVREDFDGFEVMRRHRASGNIPSVSSVDMPWIVEGFSSSETVKMYRKNPVLLVVFELGSIKLSTLEVSAVESSWNQLISKCGRDGISAIYLMMKDRLERDDANKVVAAVTSQGRMLITTRGCVIPVGMEFPSEEFTKIFIGTCAGLEALYTSLKAYNAVLMFIKKEPYSMWPSARDMTLALLGFPYSLYLNAEPYVVDFWLKVWENSPTVYAEAKDEPFYRTMELRNALLASNLELVNHLGGSKNASNSG